jgi:STE24 endopeptidase
VGGDELTAAARLRPIAHDVAKAPDGVHALAVDRREDGLEGVEIPVHVGDDRDPHARRARLARFVIAVGLAVLFAVGPLLLLRTEVPQLDLPRIDPGSLFSVSELARAERYASVVRWLWIGTVAAQLLALGLLAWQARPLSRRLAQAVPVLGRRPLGMAVALAAIASLAFWLAPLALLAVRQWWERRYGLSEQSYGGWLQDRALSLTVTTVIVVAIAVVMVWLATRLGARWVLPGGIALASFGALVVLAQPVLVQPLFNRFVPLSDRELTAEIQALGSRLGVEVEQVEVADASRRTTAANAFVTGIGPTRRVALYDTFLDGRFTRAEILSVSAHELAHVSRSHVWKAVAWFSLFAIAGTIAVGWILGRRGGLADPALVPLALLATLVLYLATLPAQNAISRRYEAEADWLALRTTGDPDGAVALYQQLARTNLADPTPPAWSRIVLRSHPTVLDRVAMAESLRTRG